MWATRAVAAAGVLTRIVLAADFDWSAIEPSEQLKYHPCYDSYQCARLSVPYDPRFLACRAVHLCSFFNNGYLADWIGRIPTIPRESPSPSPLSPPQSHQMTRPSAGQSSSTLEAQVALVLDLFRDLGVGSRL